MIAGYSEEQKEIRSKFYSEICLRGNDYNDPSKGDETGIS